MITFVNTTTTRESRESILFQSVLKAYPTCIILGSSWLMYALGNLKKQWRMFIKQIDRTQHLLKSFLQKPLAPSHLLSPLESELTNLDRYPHILKTTYFGSHSTFKEGTFIWLSLSLYHTCMRRSLLPFLGDAFSWLTGTAMTIGCHQYYAESQWID